MNYEKMRTMTDEEARLYYGENVYSLIKKIYEVCKKSDHIIYQHATDLKSADNIMQKGFIVYSDKIDNIPTDILKNKPIATEYYTDEAGDKIRTSIYNGGQHERGYTSITDELADTQHFFENTNCNLDFGSLSNPDINRSGDGTTCLFVVSKYFTGSREYRQYGITDTHYDYFEDKQVPKTYFERRVIPTQFCIGYLDVRNKKFVFNPKFQFNYGVTDDFTLSGTTTLERDLSIEIENSIKRR